MKVKIKMLNGKIEEREIKVLSNPIDDFASVGDTGESIQGTYQG